MPAKDYTMHYFPPTRLLARLLETEISKQIGGFSGKKVLDAGCGEGYHSAGLSELGANVFGVDLSPGKGSAVASSDVTRIPFPNGTFDAVFSSQLLEHLAPEDFGRALEEYRRVLAQEGFAILTVPLRGPLGYWASDIGHSGPEKHENLFPTGDEFDSLASPYFQKVASYGYQGFLGTVAMASLMAGHRIALGKNHSSQTEIRAPPETYKSIFEKILLPVFERESRDAGTHQGYCYVGAKLP